VAAIRQSFPLGSCSVEDRRSRYCPCPLSDANATLRVKQGGAISKGREQSAVPAAALAAALDLEISGDTCRAERVIAAERGDARRVGAPADMERIHEEGGLGVFVRSLVGLDRAAAKRAFDGFIQGRKLTAHQLEFIDMVVDYLTERGVKDPRLLYESPFTDLDPLGVAGLFGKGEVIQLIDILRDVQGRAAA
jgi:hypothetical protein